MRCLVSFLLASLLQIGFCQSTPRLKHCPSQEQILGDESRRLQKLLREQGVDALVAEVMRPHQAFWKRLNNGLSGRNGWSYFWDSVRHAMLPEMSGSLIIQTDTELLIGVSDAAVADVKLRLDSPIRQQIQRGTKVLFVGVAADFSPQPYMLVLDVKQSDLSFLPKSSQ